MSGGADGLRAALVAAAGHDDDRIDIALRQIAEAIEFYAATRPGATGQDGRRVPRKPSQTRRILRDAERALGEFLHAWSMLDSVGCRLVGEALSVPNGFFQINRLPDLLPALRAACEAAKNLPAKEANSARPVLATDVARVLRDVLGARLATTGPDRGIRSGAHFTAVLQQALAVVGEYHADWERLAAAGLELLDEITEV